MLAVKDVDEKPQQDLVDHQTERADRGEPRPRSQLPQESVDDLAVYAPVHATPQVSAVAADGLSCAAVQAIASSRCRGSKGFRLRLTKTATSETSPNSSTRGTTIALEVSMLRRA